MKWWSPSACRRAAAPWADLVERPAKSPSRFQIDDNGYGSTGMLFTGTVGVNAVLVTGWRTTWSR
jgi:hypothetical protein